jgi:hypothetical protein
MVFNNLCLCVISILRAFCFELNSSRISEFYHDGIPIASGTVFGEDRPQEAACFLSETKLLQILQKPFYSLILMAYYKDIAEQGNIS